MYRVDGSSDLTEETLDHWEGWRGSRPVRIGNGASDQLQLDIFGEAMDAFAQADEHGLQAAHVGWTAMVNMMDWLCEHWDQPEEGIWETRGGRKDFTYGRFQCWVALDRAIRLAERRGRPADIMRWRSERDRIPQAFSHLSLINAAINLDYQLDHGVGEIQPMLSRVRRIPATGFR